MERTWEIEVAEQIDVGRLGLNFKLQISDYRAVWWWLRQVFGDAAYENYLRSQQRRADAMSCCHGSTRPAGQARVLSREEFYLDMLRRRYSGVSRCC